MCLLLARHGGEYGVQDLVAERACVEDMELFGIGVDALAQGEFHEGGARECVLHRPIVEPMRTGVRPVDEQHLEFFGQGNPVGHQCALWVGARADSVAAAAPGRAAGARWRLCTAFSFNQILAIVAAQQGTG